VHVADWSNVALSVISLIFIFSFPVLCPFWAVFCIYSVAVVASFTPKPRRVARQGLGLVLG
jgi:hypothetical protein